MRLSNLQTNTSLNQSLYKKKLQTKQSWQRNQKQNSDLAINHSTQSKKNLKSQFNKSTHIIRNKPQNYSVLAFQRHGEHKKTNSDSIFVDDQKKLDVTLSKKQLKHELSSKIETIRVSSKSKQLKKQQSNLKNKQKTVRNDTQISMQNFPISGLVKQKLQQDKRSIPKRKVDLMNKQKQLNKLTCTIDILQKSRQNIGRQRSFIEQNEKNPEQDIDKESIYKQINKHHQIIYYSVEKLKSKLKIKQQLCKMSEVVELIDHYQSYSMQLIKLAESREKAITKRDKTEGKVISKINSLEQKNINLMQLVNKLKRKGIDVDNCWAQN